MQIFQLDPTLTAKREGDFLPGRILAAPSWVFSGTVAENCAFLNGKVQEIGLLFMESASALAYDAEDLPLALAELGLSWHVHLPVDLPWENPDEASGICLALMDKVSFLGAERAVLHPPCAKSGMSIRLDLLEAFMGRWQASGRAAGDIFLENQPDGPAASPTALLKAAGRTGASLCLDLAHLLLGNAGWRDLPEGFMERVRLLHLCAPAANGEGHHAPLTQLDERGRETGRKICRRARPDTIFMLEIFKWRGIEESLPILTAWMEDI